MADSALPKAPNWTPAQQDAIRATGQSILVSAAAGSGKTSVLAERCVYLVADAPQPCNIDELLVVTFTDAAAGEMRSRIERALAKALGSDVASPRARRLARQLTLLGHAQISTIHGFCSRLIRQNFHLLGLDPQFTVIEQDAANLLLDETITELFEQSYVRERFRSLIDLYGSGSDAPVIGAVTHVYQTLRSVVDPAGWRSDKIAVLAEAGQKALGDSALGRKFIGRLIVVAEEAVKVARAAEDGLSSLGAEEKYCKYAGVLVDRATRIREAVETGRIDLAKQVMAEELSRQPNITAKTANAEELRQLIVPAKESLNSKSELAKRLAFDPAALQEGMKQILPFAEELLQLVDLLEQQYSQAKRDANALDFSDLERLALQLLRDAAGGGPSDVARACHQRFTQVLVDEYQDINDVQNEILRLTSTECLISQGKCGNLFCVGDVKQSIYRFRLARPELFTGRERHFHDQPADGRTIHLRENFRSRAGVLEAINAIFTPLMISQRSTEIDPDGRTEINYNDDHLLVPRGDYPPDPEAFAGTPVDLYVIDEDQQDQGAQEAVSSECGDAELNPEVADKVRPDDDASELERCEREALHVGRIIRDLLGYDGTPRRKVLAKDEKGDGSKYRDIKPGDIVILLRTMRGTANVYVRQLLGMGVRAYADSRNGFFDAVEISDIMSLLEVIDNQQQDISLAAVLRGPVANLVHPEDAMACIRLFALEQDPRPPFHQAVALYALAQNDELAIALQRVLADLARWRQLSRQCPVDELIWTVLQDSAYLAFCAALDRGGQRIGNLMELHRRAQVFASCEKQGLYPFLQMMHGIAKRSDIGEAAARAGDDTVRIMTIHASKGLEFPVVILPDLGRKFNLIDARGSILLHREAGLALEVANEQRNVRYNSLASILVSTRLKDATVAEEMRTLYVALTRAKEHLVLLGSASGEQIDRWKQRGGEGAFSAAAVMGVGCSLQWLLMLADSPAARSHLAVHELTDQDLAAGAHSGSASCGRLAPVGEATPTEASGAGASDPAADAIARIAYQYPYMPLSRIAAVQSVTGLSKSDSADQPVLVGADPEDAPVFIAQAPAPRQPRASGGREMDDDDLLPPPSFLAESGTGASAADRGIATHAVLQYLDFATADATLQHQIDAMVQRHQLTPQQAQLVDLDSIRWLLASEIGELLKQGRSHRELPFYFPAAPPAGGEGVLDPMDHIMVRGRLDAIVPTPQGLLIIDYKTDRAVPQPGSERAIGYQKQCGYYRQAIERMGGSKVAGVRLVFLVARVIVDA